MQEYFGEEPPKGDIKPYTVDGKKVRGVLLNPSKGWTAGVIELEKINDKGIKLQNELGDEKSEVNKGDLKRDFEAVRSSISDMSSVAKKLKADEADNGILTMKKRKAEASSTSWFDACFMGDEPEEEPEEKSDKKRSLLRLMQRRRRMVVRPIRRSSLLNCRWPRTTLKIKMPDARLNLNAVRRRLPWRRQTNPPIAIRLVTAFKRHLTLALIPRSAPSSSF